jgi:hypothetical protein
MHDENLCSPPILPKVYISAILDPIIGFGITMCLKLVTRLDDTYGWITEAEVNTHIERIKNQWNPPTSIEILFTQINEGVTFLTAGGDPPTGPSIIRIAYNIVAAISRFDVATHECRNKAAAEITWTIFQTHFKAADSDN